MKIVIELTAEDFKAKKGLTLDELLNGAAKGATKKATKKQKEEPEEDEEEDFEEEDEDEEEEDEGDEVDADLIKQGISAAIKAGNKEEVANLFKKYKAKTVSNLAESKYTAFYNALKPLTKKAR